MPTKSQIRNNLKKIIYDAVIVSSVKYVTWIKDGDYFVNGAMEKMSAVLDTDSNIKAVCADWSVDDGYGEKFFLPLSRHGKDFERFGDDPRPRLGKEYVTQNMGKCFLVDKDFLLSVLKDCKLENLWEQYLWNSIYNQGYYIEYIHETLFVSRNSELPIEQKQSIAFLLKYYQKNNYANDLLYFMELIEQRLGTEYLKKNIVNVEPLPSLKTEPSVPIQESNRSAFVSSHGRTLVINLCFPGLGDSLFLSHLPQIAKESGQYDKVYIHEAKQLRSKEILELVWLMNPYVDGITEENEQFPDSKSVKNLPSQTGEGNLLDDLMLLYGLDDGKRYHEPIIYYKPRYIKEFKNKIVYDPNYVSFAADNVSSKDVYEYFAKRSLSVDIMLALGKKYVMINSIKEIYKTKSLRNFCDILYSAKEVFCFATGTATLCAALEKKANVFYDKTFNKVFLHSRINNYIEL